MRTERVRKEEERQARREDQAKVQDATPAGNRHETAGPDATGPRTTRPDLARPHTAGPEAARPEAARPEAARPDPASPHTARPEATRSETPAEESSSAWRSMRWNRTIFGRTPEIWGIPAPVIVVGAALLAAVLILYLVISRQSPLVGGDTGDPGQPVQPEIQQEAPVDPG